MDVRFLGQPFPAWDQIGGVIKTALSDPATDRVWFATAWAKRSGLGRVRAELLELQLRGVPREIVVGVDEGGATIEGLRLTIELFDAPFVFHDPGARTFHPKVYVVETPASAVVVVGSGNLTRGGLFTNYEAGLVCRLEKTRSEDREFLDDVRRYFDQLLATTPACQPLDDDLVTALRADARVIVASEGAMNRRRAGRSAAAGQPSMFGGSVPGLAAAPPSSAPPLPAEEHDSDDIPADADTDDDADVTDAAATEAVVGEVVQPDEGSTDGETASPGDGTSDGAGAAATPRAPTPPASPGASGATSPSVRGFFKTLSANDVSERDSPGQIIIPIGFLPFFGPLTIQKDESASGGPRLEHAEFPVEFVEGSFVKIVPTARVILYVPASMHKRQNNEVRLTFRNTEIQRRLSQDDVLAFSRTAAGIKVERHGPGWRPAGWTGSRRYGAM